MTNSLVKLFVFDANIAIEAFNVWNTNLVLIGYHGIVSNDILLVFCAQSNNLSDWRILLNLIN